MMMINRQITSSEGAELIRYAMSRNVSLNAAVEEYDRTLYMRSFKVQLAQHLARTTAQARALRA